jgi:divalent metal cation (Fe/Co/Zn/Cd) transporter
MDKSLPAAEVTKIQNVLQTYETQGIQFHAVRSRSAASRGFVSMHILVPGQWSVQHGHKTAEQIETEIRNTVPQIAIFTHVEPLEDPISFEDTHLETD